MATDQTAQVGDRPVLRVKHVLPDGTTLSIASADLKEFEVRAPNGVKTIFPGIFVTDGTDGEHRAQVDIDFFDAPGLWRWQSHVDQPGMDPLRSRKYSIEVISNL